jgi:hypothetical protein
MGHLGTIDHPNLLHDVADKSTVSALSLIGVSPKMILLDLRCGVDLRVDGG